jgi:hypothetical protein
MNIKRLINIDCLSLEHVVRARFLQLRIHDRSFGSLSCRRSFPQDSNEKGRNSVVLWSERLLLSLSGVGKIRFKLINL